MKKRTESTKPGKPKKKPLKQQIDKAFTLMERLNKDIEETILTMGNKEVQHLVKQYYSVQQSRIRFGHQLNKLLENKEPHLVLAYMFRQMDILESQIRHALDYYSSQNPIGSWSRTVVGIGPVIASGLLAYIDMDKAPTVGHIWNFGHLNPGVKWEAGKKRPFCLEFKVLCRKIGESFLKQSGRDECFYGKIYLWRKEYETKKNIKGDYADQAKVKLASLKKNSDTYKYMKSFYDKGMLSPGHIISRAKRYATKLFLSEWHEVAHLELYGKPPPIPYAIEHLGHAHDFREKFKKYYKGPINKFYIGRGRETKYYEEKPKRKKASA